jgi:site-specific recombinase XerD
VREDDELGAVIAAFLEDAAADRTRSREELRELRRALDHVDSELGRVGVGAVGGRDVLDLVDELGAAGLPASRTDAIVDALRAVYAYAIAQGIVRTSPLVGLARPVDGSRSPTDAMLELGERVVAWSVRGIVIAFVIIAVGLAVAIA